MTVNPAPNSFRNGPDEQGRFGIFGGRFVAETLMPLILDLEKAYAEAKTDPAFRTELDGYLKHYVGRPSPLSGRSAEDASSLVQKVVSNSDAASGQGVPGTTRRPSSPQPSARHDAPSTKPGRGVSHLSTCMRPSRASLLSRLVSLWVPSRG